MSTQGGAGTPPPPPQLPPHPPPPPRMDPPRWAWWVGGIAIPLVGIVVTMIAGGGREPAAAPAPVPATSSPHPDSSAPSSPAPDRVPEATSSSPEGPTASASTEMDLQAPAGYAQVPVTMWGLAPAPCRQREQQLVDLDDGQSRVEPEDNGAVKNPAGAELLYWPDTCTGLSDYMLRALPNTRVGLLRVGMPKSFESCKAAAGAGFGALALPQVNDRKERGFVEGAALCSVTDRGAVAMAVIEHVDPGVKSEVSVTGSLYVWSKSP